MTLLNKKYCSHCGTPNPREQVKCVKCGKPISSALRVAEIEDDNEEEVVVVRKKKSAKAVRYVNEDGEDEFTGDIVIPSSSDITVQAPTKLTVGSLKDGAQVPNFGGGESLPTDIEVSSRSYFHQENLD